MLTMFNFKNWKRHSAFYLLLAFCVSLLFIKNAATHRGKHNFLHTNVIQHTIGGFLAGVTVHDGLEYDRWADPENPRFISTNLHPLGKYQKRDIEWTDGFKREFWNPQPPEKIEFWLRARVTGIGKVEFSGFTAEVYGQTYGPEETEEDDVGWVVPLFPRYHLEENYEVYQYLEGPNFNTAAGTYEWTASGNVRLMPYTYGPPSISVGTGVGVSFAWTLDKGQTPTYHKSSGSWIVEHRIFKRIDNNVDNRLTGNFRCDGCSEKVSTRYQHTTMCPNPKDNSYYYTCLQTAKWWHYHEDICSDANCADTDIYRCTHTHTEPSPPDYPEEDPPPPPDVAGVCGHTFSTTELASHAPAVGSCGHTYSPCTPGNHISYVCNIAPCSNRVWWGCVSTQCPETSSHGTTTIIEPQMHVCGVHATSVSGDHTAAGCGTSGHYACDGSNHAAAGCGTSTHFACDGLTHTQVQCTVTNANGDQCTHTYWACLHPVGGSSHNHQYPTPAPAPEPMPTPPEETTEMHPCETHPVTEPGDHSNLVCRWCGIGYNPCLSFSGECSYFGFHAP
ncbi:MAG: hypothetical protein OXI43_02395 [Candidatus Poribacteria bacterium]|nr:hypothetical protein [Candidatus Poribacteria bacterium]